MKTSIIELGEAVVCGFLTYRFCKDKITDDEAGKVVPVYKKFLIVI